MNVIKWFFLTGGRASRLEFWIVHLVSLPILFTVAFFAFVGGAASQSRSGAVGALLVVFVAFLVTIWVSYACAGRRFHDRNKSAWMIVAFLALPALFWLTLLTSGAPAALQLANNGMIKLANGALTLWYIVELGFMGPVDEGNTYGTPGSGGAGRGGLSAAQLDDQIGSLGSAHAAMEAAIMRQQQGVAAPRAAAAGATAASGNSRRQGVAVRAGGAVGGGFGKRNRG